MKWLHETVVFLVEIECLTWKEHEGKYRNCIWSFASGFGEAYTWFYANKKPSPFTLLQFHIHMRICSVRVEVHYPISGSSQKTKTTYNFPILWRSCGSVGCAVRLETRRSRVQPPPRSAISFVETDHEIFSTVILSFPLIQEGQLSVSGERMCTILVNHLED